MLARLLVGWSLVARFCCIFLRNDAPASVVAEALLSPFVHFLVRLCQQASADFLRFDLVLL